MSPCHVLGRGPGEQRLWVPMHPALGPGASVVLPLAPRGRAPAAFDLEPESLRVRRPLALHATPFTPRPSRSLSPLCSFLRFLQLFFPQSSGPQLGSPGLLLALLARYRCPRRVGGGLPRGRPPAHGPCLTVCAAALSGCGPDRGARGAWDGDAGGLAGGRGCCWHLRSQSGLAWRCSHCCHLARSP